MVKTTEANRSRQLGVSFLNSFAIEKAAGSLFPEIEYLDKVVPHMIYVPCRIFSGRAFLYFFFCFGLLVVGCWLLGSRQPTTNNQQQWLIQLFAIEKVN